MRLPLLAAVTLAINPLQAQTLSVQPEPVALASLSIGAPARVHLSSWSTEWLVGQVGETADGCYVIMFFPLAPGDLPWATMIAPLAELEVAVGESGDGLTWQPVSIEALSRSEPPHCRKPAPHLISRRAATG